MPTTTQFCTMQMGISPLTGGCDLVIAPSGNGRGRIDIDRTPASSLLIAIGTDRRADPDDVTPDMQTAPTGTAAGLFSRRGWVGDILLPSGQRLGSRVWLYERGKRNEATRTGIAEALTEAVAPIEDYHGIEVSVDVQWNSSHREWLNATVSTLGTAVMTQVQTL
ncbi:phage GP46 family protein [Gluconobacter potus]|uniref:phage GP46 family protein n=1 Tax=Gluconobacter potus TaxID=2724927 RepID=UPI0007859299|nr:phage GP46 family protein [Gluconobacter potus]